MSNQERDPARSIVRVIRENTSFLLCLHRSPDGDSIGSSLALARALTKLGKKATVVSHDPVPSVYAFLPGIDSIQPPDPQAGPWEVALLLDCGSLERTGSAKAMVETAQVVVNVDHHETNSGFGDINWVDPTRAAAGQMVLEILEALPEAVDSQQATCLYAAMATDTGFFSFGNTSSSVHTQAARLIEMGACPEIISRNLNENRSLAGLKLLGLALGSLEVLEGGLVGGMSLARADLEKWQASSEDLDGIVNYARSLSGAEVGFLLVEENPDRVKVGLRSRTVDVGQVASRLGGGGHPNAAGAMAAGSLSEVYSRVMDLLREALASEG